MENRNTSLSQARSQNAERKPIRPFICGTFKDFNAERDYLNQAIFPQLDSLCRQRGLRFLPVDLRWNSKQGQTTSDQILRVCLDNVERCSPFFICMLGERYGVHRPAESEGIDEATEQWLDRNFDTAALCGYQWVHEEEYRYSSLTELEVVQASFRKKYDYGYFYFRNSEIPDKPQNGLMTDEGNKHPGDQSETEYAARKLKELKQQIIDTELPVRTFKSPQELGELVLQDWRSIINDLYPPINTTVFQDVKSEIFRQWALHESFAKSRCSIFVRSPHIRELMDILNVHAEKDQGIKRKTSMALTHVLLSTFMTTVPGGEQDSLPPILVLTGEQGCGKSALVCNWLKQFKAANPDVVIIPHHVGCDAASTDPTNLMHRCTQELRAHYLNSDFAVSDTTNFTSFHQVTQAFNAAVELGPCVILIDGANAFGKSHDKPTHEAKELDWLPVNMPRSCRIVVTTVSSDITYRALKKRSDTYFIEVSNILDSKAQRNLFNEYVGANYSNNIDDQQFAKISTSVLRHLPLYYVSMANELRVLAAHKNSERQIEMYIHATTICDLWKLIVRRWTHDYGWLRPVASRSPVIKTQASRDRMNSGWVADALRLMSVARNGLTDDEMLGALKAMGYANKFAISSAYWSMLRILAQNAFLEISSGLLTFSHKAVRNAVDVALLGSLTSPSQERVISPFSETWERQKQQCHVVLSNFFTKEPMSLRRTEELPWQLMVSGNLEGLRQTLSDLAVFLRLAYNKRDSRLVLDLMCYWNVLSKEKLKPQEILEKMASTVQDRLDADQSKSSRIDSAHGYSSVEQYSVVSRICAKSEEDLLAPIEVATILFHIGRFLKEAESYPQAESYLLSAYKIGYPVASVQDQELLCNIQSTLGDVYAVLFDTNAAEMWYTNAIKTASQMTSLIDKKQQEATIGRLFNQLAYVRMGSSIPSGPTSEERPRSRRPSRVSHSKSSSARSRPDTGRDARVYQTVEPLLDKALKHMELANCYKGMSDVYFNMGLLRMKQHQWSDARASLQTALDMRTKWFGNTHPLVAEVMDVMGTLCCSNVTTQHDVTEPEKLYREALRMREKTLGTSHLLVASTLFKLGKLLYTKNTKDTTKEARQLFQRALDIRTTKLGVYHNSTKAVRRALMSLETTDVALQFGTSLAIKEQPLVLLRDYKQQLIGRSTSRLTIQGKSS